MNPYYYLYYIIFKFLDLNATSETKVHVSSVSESLLLIGLTNYHLSFILIIKPFRYIDYSIPLFAIILVVPIIALYFVNKQFIIKERKYEIIKNNFDKNNKLTKTHFTFLAILYLVGSIVMMIWAGINY
jgi:hypothetical protein